MNIIKNTIWYIVVVFVAAVTTIFIFNKIILFPSHFLHELGGDSIKNFYVYATHAMWGEGWWFTGMNYPYGEHLIYTDGFPLLSLPLTWIREVVSLKINHVTAVLNITLASAFFLAIIYVYRILRLLSTDRIFSLVGAVLIAAMSPHLNKVFGHYGLAMICVMPMAIFYTMRYHINGRLHNALMLFITSTLAIFMHPYFIALILIWVLFYALSVWVLQKNTFSNKIRFLLPIVSVPVAGIIILKFLMLLTDPVSDRPKKPYGSLSECTTGRDIFTSDGSPFWIYLKKIGWLDKLSSIGNEHYAYIGIVALALTVICIVSIIYRYFKKVEFKIIKDIPHYRVWLLTGFLSLLFGMGVPFVWGMDWLFDYLPGFRQFRTMGRFSQIYYYVATILTVAVLYHWFKIIIKKNKKFLGFAVIFLLVIIWSSEAYTHVYEPIRKRSEKGLGYYNKFVGENDSKWRDYMSSKRYSNNDFQAILALPYIHVGSEKIWTGGDAWWGFCVPLTIAYQLHLPVVNAHMSRSSWSITFDQVKIAAGPFARKPILEKTQDSRPFLLLVYEDYDLNSEEQFLLSISDSIGRNGEYNLFALYPEKLKMAQKNINKKIDEYISGLDKGDDISTTTSKYYYEHLSAYDNKNTLADNGAISEGHPFSQKDIDISVKDWPKNVKYECSFWTLVSEEDHESPFLDIFFNTEKSNISSHRIMAKEAMDSKGFWIRGAESFTIPENCTNLVLTFRESHESSYIAIDEILLKQDEDTVIYNDGLGNIMVNNHVFIR